MTTKEKITKLAEQKVAEKRAEQEKQMQESLDKDIADVETVLKAINDKLLYKKGHNYYDKWELVTEEIFYNDYFKDCESAWKKGINFCGNDRKNSDCYVEINGAKYFDIRYLINDYAEKLRKAIEFNAWERDRLKDKEYYFKEIMEEEPHIKKMMEEYLEAQKMKTAEGVEE